MDPDTTGSLGHAVTWIIILAAAPIAIISLVTASRRGHLGAADFATLVLPTVTFFAIANREAQEIGLGLYVWSIQIALVCMYALGFKVFILNAFVPISAKATSKLVLLLLVFAASAFAAFAPVTYLRVVFRT